MSKSLLFLFAFLATGFIHHKTVAQVPNGDFEVWQTIINQSIQGWMQSGKVSAIANSQQGPYAVKLEHDSTDHSTAILLHGGYVNGVGFTGGFPYSQRPDSISGYFKCYSPNPLDLALLHVITKKNGIQLSADYFFINVNTDTSQFQFKKFKINYNGSTEIPDSIIILLANPNPFQDSLYSGYLVADNLRFNTTQPIPNGNFDDWQITQVDNPFDWASFNLFGIISGNYPVHRVTDCVSGTFAAKSQNIVTPSDTVPGVLVSSVGGSWPARAFPINQRHTSLKGSYKFLPENNDTLTLILLLYKSDTVVGVASFKTADSADTYRAFDIPVVYWEFFFGIPDSALLYVGPYNFDGGAPRGNSVMYIDNLHFVQNNQIVINEIVSSNTSSLYDAEGNAEDWIELYNGGSSPVVINNYFLSDDTAHTQKWRLPMYLLPPDSFLVVFASGRDTYYPDLHTNFQIKTEGEPILLTSPTGQIINALPPRELAADISWGRYPDASSPLFLFAEPTPRRSNNTSYFQGFTEAIPSFSLPPGFYTDSIYLGISSTLPGAQIRYTLDGSEPTLNSTPYTSPILLKSRAGQPNTYSMIEETTPWWGWAYPQGEVFKTNIVRAKVFINDSISLRTATGTYYVDDSIFSRYTLPVLSLVTDSLNLFGYEKGIYIRGKIYDDYVAQHPNDTNLFTPANYFMRGDAWERPVHIEYFSNNGQILLSQDAGLRAHGGASRMFRQKALKLYSRDKYGNDYFDYPVFPGHKAKVSQDDIIRYKNLLLRTSGNDNDQTFFRDAMVHTLVSHTTLDVMALQPTSVFLNGEYWGIHNFREREDKYYLEQHYGVDPDSVAILESFADVSEGNDSDRVQYLGMLTYIDTHDMAIPSDFDFVATQMDIDNFLDYQSIEIYIRNTDWPGNNIRYWRKRLPQNMPAEAPGSDGRWRWLLFDSDFGFGLQDGMNAPVHNTLEFATDSDNVSWPNPEWSTYLFRKLLENTGFRNAYINRTADHMNTSFKPQRVLNVIDSLQALYEHDMADHIYRWHETGTVNDWHQMIDIMRNFAVNRPPNMKQHILAKWNLSGTINITADVSSPLHGSVKISSILINEDTKGITGLPYPWTGSYFKDIPVPVKAIAKPGYVFKEWEGTGITTPDIILNLNHDTAIKALFEVDTTYQNVSLSINELMAVNNSFITDEYGAYDDWLEIYNPGNDTVDIGGYYITDDPLHITKHQLPQGHAATRIPPQGFMVLWADDEPQQGPLHLPFKLATSGEKLMLHAPNQTLKDSISYGYQLGNRSYGRYPDASTTLVTFTTPTPGASNVLNSTHNLTANETPFRVYPNPAQYTVYFSKTSDIKVYDSMGRLLAEKEHIQTLDISGFGKGIYLIYEKQGEVVKMVVF